MSKEFKIDFIGIGAPRCATGWVFNILKEHKEVCFSFVKETQFFNMDYNYEKGLAYYENFFKGCPEGQIKGEFTPAYYLQEKTAQRIKNNFPRVKLLIVLRNPMQRAYSHYLFNKTRGVPVKSTFEKEIERNPQYINDGFYYRHLSKFLKYFNSNQVLVVIYEDIILKPEKTAEKIYKFLNIDYKFIPSSLNKIINSYNSSYLKIPLINQIMQKIWRKTRGYQLGRKALIFFKLLGLNKVAKFVLEVNRAEKKSGSAKEQIRSGTNKKLKEIFESDIKKLENFIGRDLSFWQ